MQKALRMPVAVPLRNSAEDWRILRALSLYRLLLITLLLLIYETGYGDNILDQPLGSSFHLALVAYALTSLPLLLLVIYRTPRGSIQVHLHFATDLLGLTTLVYCSGGVSSGIGILLITSAVSCALLLSQRMAIVHAAAGTLALFSEEIIRQSANGFSATVFTSTGLLGLMLFATSSAASAAAQRARKSEELAERVGSEFADLSRLNESIIESMHTGVVVVDADRRIRTINLAGARLLGARSALDRPLSRVSEALDLALEQWLGGSNTGRAMLAASPGGPEVVPRFSRLGWSQSPPILILLDDAVNLREQAQQMKLASLGRLSASIAHEIRNPLSAITHAGQLLAETPDLPGENQRLLAMIQRHSGRIEKIVKDVLDLSKREAAEREDLALKDWLLRATALYQEGYPQRARHVALLEVPEDLTVTFDPTHLQQVLFNLWDNCFEHGAGDGVRILMHAGRDDSNRQAYLEVADNGPGIPAELQDRIFEPFFTTSASGTGLGLYLSRELCEYNQARLVHRPQDQGACFRIYFSQSSFNP